MYISFVCVVYVVTKKDTQEKDYFSIIWRNFAPLFFVFSFFRRKNYYFFCEKEKTKNKIMEKKNGKKFTNFSYLKKNTKQQQKIYMIVRVFLVLYSRAPTTYLVEMVEMVEMMVREGNAPASWRSFCLTLRATGEEANLGAFC